MAIFEIIAAIIVICCLIYSMSRGMIREFFSLLTIGISYVIAVRYQVYGAHWFEDFITNHTVAHLIAFVFLFFLSGLIFSRLSSVAAKLLHTSDKLSGIGKLAGGVFGLLKAYIFIVILMFPLQMYPDAYQKLTRGSKLAPAFTKLSGKLIENLDAQGSFTDEMKMIAHDNALDKAADAIFKAEKDIEKSIEGPQAEPSGRDETIINDFLDSFQIVFNHIISEHKATALLLVLIISLSTAILGFRWLADSATGTIAELFNRSMAFLGDKTRLSFFQRFGKMEEVPSINAQASIRPSRNQVDGEFPARPRVRKKSPGSVFISYRRDKGSQMARIVKSEIEKRNYTVFLDVDDIGAEQFDAKLLKEIESSQNFILILAPGSLDRCVEKDDWLRKEIAHAIKTKRNIVPMIFNGFQYPAKELFEKDILELMLQNGVTYSHEYHDAAFNKLLRFLKEP